MTRAAKLLALGFRVKSGFAVGVAVSGAHASPSPAARCNLELSDPRVEASRQPYHRGMQAQDDETEIARLTRVVRASADESVAKLVRELKDAEYRIVGATLVVGSLIDPTVVANPHVRAHAHEGHLFRTALADALRAHDVPSTFIVDKSLEQDAVKALRRPSRSVAAAVNAFGRAFGPPWRADEKQAATAAWVALARRR